MEQGIDGTAAFTSDLFDIAKAGVAKGATLKQVYDEAMAAMRPKYGHWVIFEHCMPFDVSRAYDEAQGARSSPHLDRRARCRDVAGARARHGDEVSRDPFLNTEGEVEP